MKTLYLVRHAKSSWDYENISDIDRPLKIKGIRDSYEIARRLKLRNLFPDIIISSPANRAIHTALIFIRVLEVGYDRLKIFEDVYDGDIDDLKYIINNISDDINSVMLVGHNPVISELASSIIKELDTNNLASNKILPEDIEDMPTCSMITITSEIEKWKEFFNSKLKISSFDKPGDNVKIELN